MKYGFGDILTLFMLHFILASTDSHFLKTLLFLQHNYFFVLYFCSPVASAEVFSLGPILKQGVLRS